MNECLVKLKYNDRMAVIASYKHAMSNRNVSKSMIYCFKDDQKIFSYPVTMFMPTEHPLQEEINGFIQIALASGLFKKWSDESHRLLWLINGYYMDRISKKPSALNLTNFYVPLAIGCTIIIISFLVFALEHIVHSKARSIGGHRFWKIIDMMIDGDRHFTNTPMVQSSYNRHMCRREGKYDNIMETIRRHTI